MVAIDATCSLESFRKFVILSTCNSFIPESYLEDYEVFPEREASPGPIYVEAADKVTLKKIRDMTFVNAKEVLGIKWQHQSKVETGKKKHGQSNGRGLNQYAC